MAFGLGFSIWDVAIAGGGGSGPAIRLVGSTLSEDAALGGAVGTFSIANATGNWLDPITYTLTDTAGNRFAVDGDDLERGATAVDYEAATSHSITVEADNGTDDPITRTFTITVTNVLEVTLNALTLDDDTIPSDAIIGSLVGAIEGRTADSTLSIIDTEGGKYDLSGLNIITAAALVAGTDSITIREEHADALTVDTPLNINVTTPVDYIPTYHIYGF
jgi:hypothetical protein